MKNILIIINFTLREALARKVFIFFIAVSALFLIGLGFAFSLMDSSQILTTINPSNDQFILGQAIGLLEVTIITPLSLLCLLLAIFSTSSFVPNMLEKGNIDLLLSKPISRLQLITGKYLGSIIFIFINIGLLILGVWLMISFKFSYWDASFLWSIVIITFTYAVLYSIILLFGIVTKSSIFGMMIAYFIYLILSPALLFVKANVERFSISEFFKEILKGLYYLVPKTQELMTIMLIDISTGKSVVNFQPVISSSLFLLFIFGCSVFLFTRKDF